jgi:hypothetical protein
MELNLGTQGAKRASFKQYNFRALAAKLLNDNPRMGKDDGLKKFIEALYDDENSEEYIRSCFAYCWDNAFEAATREEERERKLRLRREDPNEQKRRDEATKQRRYLAEKATQEAIQKNDQKVEERATFLFLSWKLANDKPLGECTGAELRKIGGFFKVVADRVGDRKVVGKVLSEGQLQEMYKQFQRQKQQPAL